MYCALSAAAALALVAIGFAFSRPVSPLLSRDAIESDPVEPHRDALTVPVRAQGLFGRAGALEQIESDERELSEEEVDELQRELAAEKPIRTKRK